MTEENQSTEQQQQLALLEGIDRIRRVIHNGQEWWSVVDVVGFLTNASNPSKYWHTMRSRMQSEGAQETIAQIIELPMRSADGRHRKTDAMTRPTLLRLVQSIPSPKAEPFKLFLAEAGEEQLTQADKADSVEEMRQHYRHLGRDEEWITARILYLVTRNAWTSEIQLRGVEDSLSIAKLTSILNARTFGVTTAQHKQMKGLQAHHNLAEHKTRMELILSALAEETATGLHQKRDSQGYAQVERDVQDAGDTAADARRAVERRLGEPVVSSANFLAGKRPRRLTQQKGLPSHEKQQPTLFDNSSEES